MSSAPDKLRQRIAELAEMLREPEPELRSDAPAAELVWQLRRLEALLGMDNDRLCKFALAPTDPEERNRQWSERRKRRMAVRGEVREKKQNREKSEDALTSGGVKAKKDMKSANLAKVRQAKNVSGNRKGGARVNFIKQQTGLSPSTIYRCLSEIS